MIKCTYGDLDRLRDTPNRTGPIAKLMAATEPSIIDKFRIGKLVKAIDAELVAYGKALGELGKKYGDLVKVNNLESYQIRPADMAEFSTEKSKLDGDPCEVLANPLPLSAIEKVALTPLDLNLLSLFVTAPTDL
jgi:hypothetical protein